MSISSAIHMSPEAYLASERVAKVRHEYRDGEVIEMVGGSHEQNWIVINLLSHFRPRLRGTGCSLFGLDMRVKVSAKEFYTYPDLAITTEKPEFDAGNVDTLINPAVIIEVLTPSTERHDRSQKFELYKNIKAFREYILIAQDQPRIEQFIRTGSDQWTEFSCIGLNETLELKSIACPVPLAVVYEDIMFTIDT